MGAVISMRKFVMDAECRFEIERQSRDRVAAFARRRDETLAWLIESSSTETWALAIKDVQEQLAKVRQWRTEQGLTVRERPIGPDGKPVRWTVFPCLIGALNRHRPKRQATPEEESELRRLVFSEHERDPATAQYQLAWALRNPDWGLFTYRRGVTVERSASPDLPHDMI